MKGEHGMEESFGPALARLRREHRPALSLRALGAMVHYSHVYLWQVERGVKPVTAELAARCDRAVGAGGELIAMAERVLAERVLNERPDIGRIVVDPGPDDRMRERFARMYTDVGGVVVRPRLLEYIRNAAEPALDRSPGRCRAVGGLIVLAGICAYDADDDAAARRHFARALDLAQMSDDAQFAGYVSAVLAGQAVKNGRAGAALELTSGRLARTGDTELTPGVLAELHCVRSEAYALAGEQAESTREIWEAYRYNDRAGHPEQPHPHVETLRVVGTHPEQPETAHLDPGVYEARHAALLRRFGELNDALAYARIALVLGRRTHRRGRANRLLVLAGILRELGRPADAAAVGRQALSLVAEMESVRLSRRLTMLAAELAPARADPGVGEFCDSVEGLFGRTP